MELALSLPVAGIDLADTVAYARQAADLGYRAAWASEVAGPDFASLCGAVAASTDLALGVAVAPVQTRSPWLLAATAATLAQLTGGRFTLGLGTSSEVIVEQWSGVAFERPLARLAETVALVRAMLAGERVSHDGEFLRSTGYRLPITPPGPVPIMVGALNPVSLRQAGAIGDGVCLNQLSPEHVGRVLAETGRAGDPSFAVVARLFCLVTDDPAGARAGLRKTFAPYLATSVYNRFYRWLGFEEEAQGVLDALAAGDRAAAAAAVSDRVLDAVTIVGDADQVAERVAAYVAAGVTLPVIATVGADRADTDRTLKAIAHLA